MSHRNATWLSLRCRIAAAGLFVAVAAALVLLVALSVPSAHGAPAAKRITGKLDMPGYTVVALGYNGKAATATTASFSIVAPASKLTLQLLDDSTGRYAGPVVVGGGGSRVIVGFKAGARLGTIDVNPSDGYAKTAKALPARFLDKHRYAQAHHGVPIGNGTNFGLVRSTRLGGGRGLGEDYDHSGVPNAFNVAEDGNKVLNNLEPLKPTKPKPTHAGRASIVPDQGSTGTTGAAGSPTMSCPPTPQLGQPSSCDLVNGFGTVSQMLLPLEQVANEDAALNEAAGDITTNQIDTGMENLLGLGMTVVPGASTYLDCGAPGSSSTTGLSWCEQGGSGKLVAASSTGIKGGQLIDGDVLNSWGPAFPGCCDVNANGLGDILNSVTGDTNGSQTNFFYLAPDACALAPPAAAATPPCPAADQIGTGDALVQYVTDSSGATTTVPGIIQFVFDTVPAVHSWSSGSDSATINYPVALTGPGTQHDPYTIGGGSGDIMLTLTFWRPQRTAIPGADPPSPSGFMDIGHLTYSVSANIYNSGPPNNSPVDCPQSAYTTTDSNLVPGSSGFGGGAGLADQAADMPSSAANTLSFSIDLTSCFNSGNIPLASGDKINVTLDGADTYNDNSGEAVSFVVR
ncbi:MAG: hypothetical protein ABSD82_13170 [Solirubrobacteraceae bacterium]